MFDFEKLDIYQLVKEINIKVLKFLEEVSLMDSYIKDEWKKKSMDIVLYLVESTGRIPHIEKREYLNKARGSVFECTALLETVRGMDNILDGKFQEFYDDYEKASKMLLGMHRSFDRNNRRNFNNYEQVNQNDSMED
ncbi:MAG: four helix bundle protein [Bacteroidota bacterium]